jgi:hypothetical protein
MAYDRRRESLVAFDSWTHPHMVDTVHQIRPLVTCRMPGFWYVHMMNFNILNSVIIMPLRPMLKRTSSHHLTAQRFRAHHVCSMCKCKLGAGTARPLRIRLPLASALWLRGRASFARRIDPGAGTPPTRARAHIAACPPPHRATAQFNTAVSAARTPPRGGFRARASFRRLGASGGEGGTMASARALALYSEGFPSFLRARSPTRRRA